MGYKYDEQEILAEAVETVRNEGLSRLTYGRLAKRLGIADRSVVYYFPTKSDLVTRTVMGLGEQLQRVLDQAAGGKPLPPQELLKRTWPALTTADADDIFAVFFELAGLGAAGVEPYDALAPTVMTSFLDWIAPKVDAPTEAEKRAAALAILATLDGLLLLRQTLGPAAASQAATTLGLVET